MQSNKEQVLRSQEQAASKTSSKKSGKGQEAKEMSVRSGLREERTVESYNDRSGR